MHWINAISRQQRNKRPSICTAYTSQHTTTTTAETDSIFLVCWVMLNFRISGIAKVVSTLLQRPANFMSTKPDVQDASIVGDAPRDETIAEKGQTKTNVEIASEPPDGGLRAWACIAGSSLVLFCTFGWVFLCQIRRSCNWCDFEDMWTRLVYTKITICAITCLPRPLLSECNLFVSVSSFERAFCSIAWIGSCQLYPRQLAF